MIRSAHKLKVLQAMWGGLWRERCGAGRTAAEESRDARLQFCGFVVGHTVASCNELSEAEMERVIQALKAEGAPTRALGRSGKSLGSPRDFPNSPSEAADGNLQQTAADSQATSVKQNGQFETSLASHIPGSKIYRRVRPGGVGCWPSPNRGQITERQLWKVRQIEQWLGWSGVSERLGGFLQAKFKGCERPERLSFPQALRAIDALFNVAAEIELKRRLGVAHQVSQAEKRAEVSRIKDALRRWQPAAGVAMASDGPAA